MNEDKIFILKEIFEEYKNGIEKVIDSYKEFVDIQLKHHFENSLKDFLKKDEIENIINALLRSNVSNDIFNAEKNKCLIAVIENNISKFLNLKLRGIIDNAVINETSKIENSIISSKLRITIEKAVSSEIRLIEKSISSDLKSQIQKDIENLSNTYSKLLESKTERDYEKISNILNGSFNTLSKQIHEDTDKIRDDLFEKTKNIEETFINQLGGIQKEKTSFPLQYKLNGNGNGNGKDITGLNLGLKDVIGLILLLGSIAGMWFTLDSNVVTNSDQLRVLNSKISEIKIENKETRKNVEEIFKEIIILKGKISESGKQLNALIKENNVKSINLTNDIRELKSKLEIFENKINRLNNSVIKLQTKLKLKNGDKNGNN